MRVLDNIQYVFVAIIVIFAFFIRKEGVSFIKSRAKNHLSSFWMPWLFIACMVITSLLCFPWDLVCLSILMFGCAMFILFKPMNFIHGLIGTRGDIRLFFGMFLFINLCFSGIYYFGFFKNSGITYELNQSHVEFNIFVGRDKLKDTIYVCGKSNLENLPDCTYDTTTTRCYHRIRYKWVLQNTLLTSLMQEPTDFYSCSCTYTGNHDEADINKRTTNCFNWFLVFHIMISWILLGVFISLIYQKFRNT